MLFVKRQQIIDAHNLYVAKIIIDNIFTIDYDIKRFRNDHKLQLPHQISRTQSTKVTWLMQYLNLKLHRQTCQFTRSSSNSYTFKSEFRTVVRLGLNNILKDRIHADIIVENFLPLSSFAAGRSSATNEALLQIELCPLRFCKSFALVANLKLQRKPLHRAITKVLFCNTDWEQSLLKRGGIYWENTMQMCFCI